MGTPVHPPLERPSLALPALVFRLALLAAIGVSAALLIDYYRPLPAFCDVGSGCYRVRASGFGSVLRVPVPLLGLLGFLSLIAISLVDNDLARRLTRILAIVGGVAGVMLLLVQGLVLQVFCKLCVAVDLAAIVAAGAALFLGDKSDSVRSRWLWPVATVLTVLLPGAWSLVQRSAPVPSEIAALWEPGKINVVEFVDFQCPFCRQLHPTMVELLKEFGERVHFVRLNMPLTSHSEARHAARAYCCAEDHGKADAMADALFQAQDLTPAGCERLAASIGLSLPEYQACVKRPATDARIDDQIKTVRSAGLTGLPTVWIGDQAFVGSHPIETLRPAFVEAASGKVTRLPTALLWAALALALAIVGALAMRMRAV